MEDKRLVLALDGKYFKRQYLLYVIELIHNNERHYYIGQTGDVKYITARSALRRLVGHLEEQGRSTQNQIYRYIAVKLLGISEAAKQQAFSEKTKELVEHFIVESGIKMYLYELQEFSPNVTHDNHLEVVRKVLLFERLALKAFIANSKILINKNIPRASINGTCPYPDVLEVIKRDFNLRML